MAQNHDARHDPSPKPTPKKARKGRSASDDRYKASERWKTNKRKRMEKEAKRKATQKVLKIARGTARFKQRRELAKDAPTAILS